MPARAHRRTSRTRKPPDRESVPAYLPFLVFSLDPSGRIVRLEGDVKRWTGRSVRSVIADPAAVIPLIHPADRVHVLGFVRAALRSSIPRETEFRCRPPAGRTFIRCRLHLQPAGGPEAAPRRLNGLVTGVPRRRVAGGGRAVRAIDQAVLENERRYRTLAESSQDMIFILDRDCIIRYVNTRAAAQFGCTPGELVGRGNHTLFPAEIAARHQRLVRQVFETRRPILTENRQEFPGRTLWLSTQLTPLVDEHGRVYAVMGVARDVTEYRRTVAALEASEEQYRTLVENVGLGVFRVGIHPSPHFVHANPACVAMFGYDDFAEMARRPGEDFFRDPADNQHILNKALVAGRLCTDLHVRRRDGSPFEASVTLDVVRDENGVPVYLDGVVEDVTERRRSEQQLRILSAAVSQACQGIAVADERHGLAYVNQAFADMMGRPSEGLLGLSLFELISPGESPAALEALSVLERTGRFSGSFTLRRADGRPWIAMVESTLLHDADGRVTGSLVTVADVTETRRIELERGRLLRAVENAAEGIGIWDPDMQMVYANAALQKLLGETTERPAARRWPEVFSGDELRASMGLFDRSASGLSWEGRLNLVRRDGVVVPVAAHCSRVAEEDGGFQVVAALRDMTREMAYVEQIRRLTADAAKSLENERARISRELHDELGQLVTAVNMNLAWLKARVPDSVNGFGERLAETGAIVNEMLEAIRRLSGSLRPPILDNLGLIEAIRSWGRDFCRRAGLKWRVTTRPAEIGVPDPLATTVFRIVQEALTNVARHARATRCEVSVVVTGGWLEVTICDDGRGAVPEDLAGLQSLGVAGMRERAAAVGGTLTVENLPGGGVCVAARLPWPR